MSSLLKSTLRLTGSHLPGASNVRLLSSYSLIFRKYGNPSDVLELVETTSEVLQPALADEEVLVEFKASPINPADINTIQGVYGVKPKLPAVPGNEGCAEVIKVGSSVKNLEPGDKISLRKPSFGTWRTHIRMHFNDLIKLDRRLDAFSASQVMVNPSTAYRMLKDYENLKQGETVLQNGANSAVGKNVIQFGKQWNLVTVNVIRQRANAAETDELIAELKELGADYVITEEQLENREYMAKLFEQVPKPRLALNCVGGTNGLNCLKYVDQNGSFVTYGAMSKRPVPVGAAPLIFKNIKLAGFWMTNWYKEHGDSVERRHMLNSVMSGYLSGDLKATRPIPFKLDQYKEALDVAMNSNVKGKVTFVP